MADFNPYHKWLGIPPDQQPVSHYRLLGIENFEFDADVIEMAAGREGQSEDENWGCNRPQGAAPVRKRNPGPPRGPGKTRLSQRL